MFLSRLNRIRHTIGFRLIVWYSSAFILSTGLLFTLACFMLASSVRNKDREDVRQKLAEYSAQYRTGGLEALKREVTFEGRTARESLFFVRVKGPNNSILLLDLPVRNGEREEHTIRNSKFSEADLGIESTPLSDGLTLEVGKSPQESEDLLKQLRELFLVFMPPVTIVGIIGGWFLSSRSLRPIRNIIHTTRSITTGQMNARVPSSQTGDELDELVSLFNAMLGKIETLIAGMRGSLDNVAHDLRTPLTRLRGTAEMALRSDQDKEGLREALADSVEEADRILTMLNTLMDISEAETGAMKLELETVDLSELLGDVVELYRYVAEDKELSIAIKTTSDLQLNADRNRLRQVLANLLDNAIKYTPRSGTIELEAFRYSDGVVVVIKDPGIGISLEEQPKIWQRLYRGDESRSQKGLGLGLSLVRAVVQAHQGTIEVVSEPGLGSTFTVHLPLTSPTY